MPPKKKAKTVKKPSPAYLAELEELKRTKRLETSIGKFIFYHLTMKLM